MNPSDRRLLRHLMLAIGVKLMLLAALWWWFVRDARVAVDADLTSRRLMDLTSVQHVEPHPPRTPRPPTPSHVPQAATAGAHP